MILTFISSISAMTCLAIKSIFETFLSPGTAFKCVVARTYERVLPQGNRVRFKTSCPAQKVVSKTHLIYMLIMIC